MYDEHTENELIDTAVTALQSGGDGAYAVLEELPAPIYVTDPQGVVIYYNQSCVGFAGRTPAIGKDRWCVTWKLYSDDGQFLAHERCPMAEAIKGKRPLRGMTAIAERPDGTRVNFKPYPTPLLSENGELVGAVNMLIDITEQRQIDDLRSQAARCLRLADCTFDPQVQPMLRTMAAEYEQAAMLLARARKKVAND
jgi:PAS domain S-box-containing protein